MEICFESVYVLYFTSRESEWSHVRPCADFYSIHQEYSSLSSLMCCCTKAFRLCFCARDIARVDDRGERDRHYLCEQTL